MVYQAVFKVGNTNHKLNQLEVNPALDGQINVGFVKSRFAHGSQPSREEINIAYQILCQYPDAYAIEVAGVNPAAAIAAIVLFLVFVLFGPIIFSFYMCGKPKAKNLFRNVLGIEQFKKFRKIYIIIGSILYAGCLAFIIVSFILLKDLASTALFILAGFDIVYFIVGILVGNSIYKKYHVDEPAPELSENPGMAAPSGRLTDEATDELLRYKKLLDAGAITEAEYETKKKQLLTAAAQPSYASSMPAKPAQEKGGKGALFAFSILALLGYVFLLVWWSTGIDFCWVYAGRNETITSSFFGMLGRNLFVLLIFVGHVASFISFLVFFFMLFGRFKKKASIICLSVSIVMSLVSLVNFIVLLPAKSPLYTAQAKVTALAAMPTILVSLVILLIVAAKKKPANPKAN